VTGTGVSAKIYYAASDALNSSTGVSKDCPCLPSVLAYPRTVLAYPQFSQNGFNFGKYDYSSVGISAASSGLTAGIFGSMINGASSTITSIAKAALNWVVETPAQVINTAMQIGIQKTGIKKG